MTAVRTDIAVLAIDDRPSECKPFESLVNDFSRIYRISRFDSAEDGDKAIEKLDHNQYDLVLLDIRFGDKGPDAGLSILDDIRRSAQHNHYPVVVLTNYPDEKFQERFLRLGVDGFLDKGHDCDKSSLPTVECILERALRVGDLRRKYLKHGYGICREKSAPEADDSVDLFGISAPMRQLFQQVFRTVADYSPPTVLVTGPTGTGKSSVARAIWAFGPRSGKPFRELVINTIPAELLPSELFGHKKGSFTGAVVDKRGLIQTCNEGTLFLDEIGELPADVQVMLLQALRERKIRMVGSDDFIRVNFQLISATNRNLDELIMLGKFRADLYHRIRGVQVRIPSLAERFGSTPEELEKIIEQEQKSCGFQFRFTGSALDLLRHHAWPGNYAELKTLVRELTTLCSTVVDDDMVASRLLKPEYFVERSEATRAEAILTTPNYRDAIKVFQDDYLGYWFAKCGGRIEEMAKRIKVNPSTIHRWKKRRGGDFKQT
jgi:DNA-binding NtrC family response regulator